MFDWQTGRYVDPLTPAGPEWRVIITGDWAARRDYAELLLEQPEGIYGDLLPLLRDNDLRIVNVETVIGDEGEPIRKNGPNIKSPAALADCLTAVPWDVATLCNNHTFDFGPEGLLATIERIEAVDCRTVGAGMTQAEAETPLRLDIAGQPVAIVNAGEGEECRCKDGGPGVSGFDEERLAARIHDLKATGHAVIVIIHAGREYAPVPPPFVHQWYHRLAAAGADLLVGHHPHVPQPAEVVNGCPIAYSTGNFVFWMDGHEKKRQGYAVRATFRGTRLADCELIPYVAEPAGLRLMTTAERGVLFDQLAAAAAPLHDPQMVAACWDMLARRIGPGMVAGVGKLAAAFADDPIEAARNLRNYFDTAAHRDLILTYTRLLLEDRLEIDWEWADELIDAWGWAPRKV